MLAEIVSSEYGPGNSLYRVGSSDDEHHDLLSSIGNNNNNNNFIETRLEDTIGK